MAYTKETAASDSAAEKNGTSFAPINESLKNTTQNWRNGGTMTPQEVLQKSPQKNPVCPTELQNPNK